MPNAENWQGDVLRDLRGATQQGTPQQGPQGPAGQPQGTPAGPGLPAQSAPSPDAGYGYPPVQHAGHPAAPAGQHQQAQQYQQQEQYQAQQAQQARQAQQAQAQQAQAQQAQAQQAQAQQAQAQQAQAQQAQAQQAQAQQAQAQQAQAQQAQAQQAQAQQAQAQQAQPYQGQQPQAAYTPSTSAHRTPDSRPVVDKSLVTAGRKPRHGQSFASRATRAVRRTVSSSAAKEVAEITRVAEVLQQPVTTGRQIAVTSIRGGAGKTTVAALLGTTYAHYRQDPVLVVEADPALGSLPLRLGAESLRWTIGDLAGIVEPQMSLLDITGYLVQLPGNAWLLPGSQGQIGAMLGSRAYEGVMVSLRRYFGVTVVDCETLPAEVARVALSAAQARILTAPATLEGVTSTYSVLQWMQGLPKHVIAGTVVVLTELVPHPGLDLAEAAEKLKSTGASVQVLPYDRHLAAGGLIRTELLAHSTREAATRLAADVFQLSQKRH
ncbi:MinD/ParA family protein [Streptomyces sp. NPDC051286]|uniref:MinD/ParA family protein n=1 Tax=Streptomyces sp. NPDC051286 TaxID=3365647 RepID=UPI0037BC8A44